MLPSPINPILRDCSAVFILISPVCEFGNLTKTSLGANMNVIITGGGGFLGSQLCKKLLEVGELTSGSGRREPIEQIVLLDACFPRQIDDPRVLEVTGDISDPDVMRACV